MSQNCDQNRKTKNPYLYQSNENEVSKQNLWSNSIQNNSVNLAQNNNCNNFQNIQNIIPNNKQNFQNSQNIEINQNNYLILGDGGVNQTVITSIFNKRNDQNVNKPNNNNNRKNNYYFINQNISIANNNNQNPGTKSMYIQSKANKKNLMNNNNINKGQMLINQEQNQFYNNRNNIQQNPHKRTIHSSLNINMNNNPNIMKNQINKINNFKNNNIDPNNIINNNYNRINQNNNSNSKATTKKEDLNPKKSIIKKNKINSNIQSQQNENQVINNNNIQQNQIKQNEGSYSFSRYKKAALTGLKNLGKISYLNSVLQLICNIRNFASYFLDPKNGKYFEVNVEKYPLSYVIHRLCTHLYPYPEKEEREIYKPDSVMQILRAYNIVYGDLEEKNPNDLMVFLLSKLHDELNSKKLRNESFINNENICNDRNVVINSGTADFTKNNNSIIANLFTWFEIKEVKCTNCSSENYSFQYYPTIELNVNDCSVFKHNKNINIADCLEFYEYPKLKKNFCDSCMSYKEATISTKIYLSPNIFIFLLDLKMDKDINFILEHKINLEKFIEMKNASPSIYELSGIVFWDISKNKYNALCISPVDKEWYFYDDENVFKFDIITFMNLYNEKKIYKPWILLYKGNNKN